MAPLDWSQCPAPDSILGKASGTWAPATVQRAIALSHVGDLERLPLAQIVLLVALAAALGPAIRRRALIRATR
jgi:hypothetical protein